MTNLLLSGVGILMKHGVNRHNDTGSTEATLQAMFLLKSLLDRMQFAVGTSHPFNGRQCHAVGLNCKHETGTHRFPVEQHSTAAADAMFTANMRPCQVEFVAEKV